MPVPSPLYHPNEKVFHSYAGCDIRAFAYSELTHQFLEIANIQTLTYSIFRDKVPVRTLGTTHARRYTRGPRTIAGSIIFTVFNYTVLGELLGMSPKEIESGAWRPVTVDQLLPFHIILLFASEYFHVSSMIIYNCEIVTEGQVMSVEDLVTENTCQYVATHISPLRALGRGDAKGMAYTARNFLELIQEPVYREIFYTRMPYDNQASVHSAMNTLVNLSGGKRFNA